MKLYGTLTSPYVRRVRIVAALAGAELELVDTSTDDGQLELRKVSPLWKIPALVVDDALTLLDSRVIIAWLAERFASPDLDPRRGGEASWQRQNLLTVIDGALDSAINAFYLRRDGADPEALPYLAKQIERVASALEHVEATLEGGLVRDTEPVGPAQIWLVTTLEWMHFRGTYPIERHEGLTTRLATLNELPAFVDTRPPGYTP